VVPKVHNGKDRTFFFFNYEGFRRRQAQTSSQQVAQQRCGKATFGAFRRSTTP
jgi:hypothetical protein